MSGKRYLLDANAIVALLQGNDRLNQLLEDADWIGISVINQIEFLVFSALSSEARQLFEAFVEQVECVSLASSDAALIRRAIEIRQQYRLKLPDAVVAAVAIEYSAYLLTMDQGFEKVSPLTVARW
jgi:tRNA(fMet)-specific endonuclease VapC